MYNIKQKLHIIIKWSPKFPPNSVHNLYHFLHWNVDEIVKMMDFTPMIMLHLWQKLICRCNLDLKISLF